MDPTSNALCEVIDEQRDQIERFLVSLASVQAFGSTGQGYPECVTLIADRLSQSGMQTELVDVPDSYLHTIWGDKLERAADYLPVTAAAPRTIVLGSRKGLGSGPTLHLTQHYDVPGFLPRSWTVEQEGAKVFAPAISRCRAGLVPLVMAATAIETTRIPLRGDLFVSATPDNHLGGETGAGYLAESNRGLSDMVITGSPGGISTIGLGYKGALWIKITTHGKAAPASEPHDGVDAIEKMVKIHQALSALGTELREQPSEWPVFPVESRYPTLVAAKIQGGAHGVAERCEMFVDRRLTPEESIEAAVAAIEQSIRVLGLEDDGFPVEIEVVHAVESAVTGPDAPLAQTLAKNIRHVVGTEPTMAVFAYYSEFRFFPMHWGAQTVNYGPGLVEAAYEAGAEYVDLDDVVAATKVIALSIMDLLG